MQSLRTRLEEAEELRRAISEGDLDALVLPGPEGKMVFTLDSADRAYRVLVETMNEGTATLAYRRHHPLLQSPLCRTPEDAYRGHDRHICLSIHCA